MDNIIITFEDDTKKEYRKGIKLEEIINDIKPEEEYNIDPSPDVIYQCNLLYLSKLCELIADKFNKEFEWNN